MNILQTLFIMKNKNSIKRLGGTMPEDLPTPEKSLKEIEKENKKIGYEKL